MGNTQNLMILLSVIVVGASIVTGLYYFEQKSINTARQVCLSELNYFSSIAKTWWNTPLEQGGGGKTSSLGSGGIGHGHGQGSGNTIDQLGIYIGHNYQVSDDTFSTSNGTFRIQNGGVNSVKFNCTANTSSSGEPINIIFIYNMKTDGVDINVVN